MQNVKPSRNYRANVMSNKMRKTKRNKPARTRKNRIRWHRPLRVLCSAFMFMCIFYSSMCGYANMCNIFCYHLLLSILANYSNLLRSIVMQFRNAKKSIPKPIHFNNRSLSMILIIIFHHSISCYLKLHWKKFVYPFEFVPQRKPIDEILTDKEKRFLISHCVCGTM